MSGEKTWWVSFKDASLTSGRFNCGAFNIEERDHALRVWKERGMEDVQASEEKPDRSGEAQDIAAFKQRIGWT